MPIIRHVPQDPTDIVIQGEELRMSVVDVEEPNNNVLGGSMAEPGFSSILYDEDAFPPMNSFIEVSRLTTRRIKNGWGIPRANAGIATPCGAWVMFDYSPLLNQAYWASGQWLLSGVTRDSAGAALGNCRVVVMDVGRIAITGLPVVTETVSDGSGNYSVAVPQNTAYQVIAYKAGAPDVAGISLNTLTPVANG